jgi:hypothetical protein
VVTAGRERVVDRGGRERIERERIGDAARLGLRPRHGELVEPVDEALQPVPVAGPAVWVGRQLARGDVDERLHDVGTPRGREVGAGRAPQWWVEELEQRHLRLDGGDHGPCRDALAAVQHHRAHFPARRVDPRHGRRAAQLAAKRDEPADERVGERLRAASGVPLPEPVVRGLPEREQRTARGGRADARVRGERGDRAPCDVRHQSPPEH